MLRTVQIPMSFTLGEYEQMEEQAGGGPHSQAVRDAWLLKRKQAEDELNALLLEGFHLLHADSLSTGRTTSFVYVLWRGFDEQGAPAAPAPIWPGE